MDQLDYDPVEASRAIWLEKGWADDAPGMAAVASVMRVDQILNHRADAVLRPMSLTFARYQVLGMLRWTGPLTLGALSRQLWITPPTVTSAVGRLERAELCRRFPHPDDARATLVEITGDGRRLFDRAVERLNSQLFGALGLPADDLETLVEILAKIRAAEGDIVGTPVQSESTT